MDKKVKESISADQTAILSNLLYKKIEQDNKNKINATTKTVLTLLGMGMTLTAAFIAPKSASTFAKMLQKDGKEWENWKKFNKQYLYQSLHRLEKQKLVEIKDIDGKQSIIITNAGKSKILKYSIEDLKIIKTNHWDRKWRVVIYDIPNSKKRLQNLMRVTLRRLGLLQIQESVYLTPYPCYDEIEFLRQYYFLSQNIKLLLVEKIEDDSVYKTYFGLS